MNHLASLSNEQLEQCLIAEAGDERQLTARVIERLAEVIRRDWHLERGFASVTEYCVEVLGYTHDQGCRRAAAARLALRYPVVPDLIRNGDISFTTLQVLSPILKAPEDEAKLLAARGMTRFEVECLVAAEDPKALRRSTVRPLDGEHFELRATISSEAQQALERLRAIDRHAVPDADIGEIVSRAIIERCEKVEARKFAKLKRPQRAERQESQPREGLPNAPVQTPSNASIPNAPVQTPSHASVPNAPVQTETMSDIAVTSRAPSREIVRIISERDAFRCSYVSPDGRRCSSLAWLEKDHRTAWAHGGRTSVMNMQLMCRAHNQYKARRTP